MDFKEGEIIAIDKPYGMSSFGALAHIRFLCSKKQGSKVKMGHAGTLDPLATGVLVLCTGKKTKQIESCRPIPRSTWPECSSEPPLRASTWSTKWMPPTPPSISRASS